MIIFLCSIGSAIFISTCINCKGNLLNFEFSKPTPTNLFNLTGFHCQMYCYFPLVVFVDANSILGTFTIIIFLVQTLKDLKLI